MHAIATRAAATPAQPWTEHLPSLTGLRAIAAALVLGVHLPYVIGVSHWQNYLNRGSVGVSFFFILSGFILTWSQQPGRAGTRCFYRRRLARVYPNHLLTWGVCILLALWEGVHTGLLNGTASLLLVQAWIPHFGTYFAADSASWSLSDEAFFYALFPLLYILLTRCSTWQRRGIGFVAALCVFVVAATVADAHPGTLGYWVAYIAPPMRLCEFIIGMIAGIEVAAGWRPALRSAVALSAAAMIGLMFVPAAWTLTALTVLPFTALIAALATNDLVGRRSVFASRPLVRLGEWSFAFYLVHEPVLRLTRDVLPPAAIRPLVSVAVAVALAALLHRAWERPWQRRIGRRARPVGRELASAAA